MRSGRRLLPLVVLLGVLAAAAAALAGTVSWGSAIEVPGIAALNAGDHAELNNVSCASAGECAAGGYYIDGSGLAQAFVVSEQGGVWGTATEVPGIAVLNKSEYAAVTSISCASAGDCAAGGFVNNYGAPFVVSEQGGVWGRATAVPGMQNLNVGGGGEVTSVSCASAGNCTAGGYYSAGRDKYGDSKDFRAFVVSEKNGKWGTAFQVGHVATHLYESSVASVSCAGVGNCVVGGYYGTYIKGVTHEHAFVAVERGGAWNKGMPVPGLAALSAGGASALTGVSCASPSNCAAVGWYEHGYGRYFQFVVSDENGKWGNAITVHGLSVSNSGGAVVISSVSCAAAGNCALGGWYWTVGVGLPQAFVVSERSGKWGSAISVPGLAALNAGGFAQVNSISCAGAGDCAAAGFYTDGSDKQQTFVVSEQSGVWGAATQVPGTASLGATSAYPPFPSVSCVKTGACAIGGTYVDGSGHDQAFVTSP